MQCEFGMPDMYFYKAVKTSVSEEEVIGFAKLTVENGDLLTGEDNGKETTQGEEAKTISSSSLSPPEVPEEDSNKAFFNDWFPEIIEIRHKHLAGKRTVMLDDLCVWPNSQRKGVGTLLLKHLLDFADDKGLPCYIESTPFAHKTYIRQGFQEIDAVEINLQRWKHDYGVYRTAILYRGAQEISKHWDEEDPVDK